MILENIQVVFEIMRAKGLLIFAETACNPLVSSARLLLIMNWLMSTDCMAMDWLELICLCPKMTVYKWHYTNKAEFK